MTDQMIGGVHKDFRHDSAHKHVAGAAVYIDDMPQPANLHHAWLVTSPHPHARIVSLDTEPALAMPGVAAVITAGDIPGKNDVGPIFDDEPALADGVVEYVGHPVAAVIAATPDQAREAAARVAVQYEPLPAVLSIEQALEEESFVRPMKLMRFGNPEEAMEAAPIRIQGEVRCGGQDHFYLESQVALAVPGEDRDMTVYSSTQHPTEVQHGVSHVLGLPSAAVTIEVRRMGGAFGGKESQATIIAAIAAIAADACGVPVKMRLPRDDDMIVTGKRHDYLFRYEIGVDADGVIQAVVMDQASRAGNVPDLTTSVMNRSLCHADNCYFIPNALFRGHHCKTHTVSNTAFRGFGGPQGMLVSETMIEHIARDLGLDVETVRQRNYYGTDDRNVTPYGQEVTDNVITEVVDRLKSEVDYDGWRKRVDDWNASNDVIKKGLALMPVKFGISFNVPTLNQAGALVHVYTDGSIHLNHGGTEMGQGLFVKVAQVVSEVFRVDLDRIKISATSTGKVPNTSATAASSGSDLNGMAALNAATEIKQRMTGVAADHFDVPEAEIRFEDNRVYAGNRSMSFAEAAELAWRARESLSATGFYKTPNLSWDEETCTGSPFFYFTYGACISEVAIDTLTGETRVLRTDILQDVGQALNPAIDLGQIEGGFVQGMGWLTMEELWWDAEGRLRTHGPSTYKIPGSRDVPPEFNVHILPDAPNRMPTIFRSKAVGEPPLMLALAVWLAIRDAVASVGGYRHHVDLDAPATPERVLFAVEDIRARDTGAEAAE